MLLLDRPTQYSVAGAIRVLEYHGPHLGRPLVDRVRGSQINNLKELRPPSKGLQAIRILFVFDPRRTAVLLVGGDKRGTWNRWYPEAIAQAENHYEKYLIEKGMM
ncbi:type II toxin-antitoxin system RelE/ParE family toxin [Pontimonas sp.]|uniref:type II toxin-antitoxin system RelE/ParE family toxin n=1 Tax=Pontimonas sp. TaxID=2304492 RepID=UPI0028704682|nr:type II toxin-antitoxin system RelE/ParE family toxin [Pontimonas sp.]MDR9396565.1 type II toxin-antitoxin system RelE/ParE family toxin [Pontimonas sp.]MDR9435001.1 type II toxin-antitoxin system RelE/ParE family toxin [Pontimonas sp.]